MVEQIKLSVVILTFNEERNIGRCIESVKALADDLLVVDSSSTDQTVEIAKRMGARVIDQPFLGYKEQKNFGLDHALFDHVLSLDADETLDERLYQSVMQAKQVFAKDGYSMNRLTNYCGKWIRHCGWYPDVKIRLFDKRKARWKGRNPHDRLDMNPGSEMGHLSGDILHYSFYTVDEHKEQIKRFVKISAHARFEEGQRGSYLKIFISPIVKFVKSYFLKLGILDGYYGWLICRYSAHATYMKYKLLMQLQQSKQ